MIFGAEEAARLTPAGDDKPKSAEIKPFQAGSDFSALLRLTRAEPITVSLAAFYRLACAYFCKAIALLQISRFAFRKKAAERNSSTSQTNKFLKV